LNFGFFTFLLFDVYNSSSTSVSVLVITVLFSVAVSLKLAHRLSAVE